MYLRVLSDFERISDHARNLGEAAEEINEKKIVFSPSAENDIERLENAVCEIMELTIHAFINSDKSVAVRVDPLEEVIDRLCDEIKANHIERVSNQECTLENGFVFNDMITDFERIGDHCSNVVIDMIETESDDFEQHEYKNREFAKEELFNQYYGEYQEKYL